MKHLLFSCRKKSHLNGKRGSMEVLERVFLARWVWAQKLSSSTIQMTGFSSKRIPPSSSTSPKEMGICSVERGVGSTTSHTKQNLFDALKRVSLACKNWLHEQCSPDCPSASPRLVLVSETKKQKSCWVLTHHIFFCRFPTDRGQESGSSSQSF